MYLSHHLGILEWQKRSSILDSMLKIVCNVQIQSTRFSNWHVLSSLRHGLNFPSIYFVQYVRV